MSSRRVWAVVAGGGTGGHVVPAIAVGRALVERGHDAASILFVGSRRGIEGRLVPAAGFDLLVLPGRGIARRLTLDNVGALAGMAAAVVRAVLLYGRVRPAVTVAVGGYASVPAAIASVVWRVPIVVAEQNAVPGLANRLTARFAAASAVSFDGTSLPRAVLTGNPVRPEVVAADTSAAGQASARAAMSLPATGSVVVVAGGSLGARRINTTTLELARRWADRSGICIYHIVGSRDFESLSAQYPSTQYPSTQSRSGLDYRMVEFEERMPLLLSAADVTVQRAGASTVAELTAIGVPAILVPLPGAPGDHQTVNARRLADTGAAVVVPDAEFDADRLEHELEELLASPSRREQMADAARSLGHPDAADRVAALAEANARA